MTPMASRKRRPRSLAAAEASGRRVAILWTPCVLLLLALMIAGCGAQLGPGSHTDQAAPTVTLRNPPPSSLDISLAVTFEQQIGDAQPTVAVGLGFLSGGRTVQFAGDERVTCDGAALSLKNRVAVVQVLRAPAEQVAGTTIHCTYSASGAVASVALQIPPAPAITSPRMGAQVVRSTHTLVSYRYDSATGSMLGIVALAPSSPTPKARAEMNTPGLGQATVDTSGFAPGPGSLALTLSVTPHIAESGAPFASVSASGMATAQVAVTWI